MMGGIGVLWKFRTAIIILFQCPRWPPHLLPNSKLDLAESNLMGSIGVTWRFIIAKSFSSNIQDGGHVGNLETLQTTSDSELLKAI